VPHEIFDKEDRRRPPRPPPLISTPNPQQVAEHDSLVVAVSRRSIFPVPELINSVEVASLEINDDSFVGKFGHSGLQRTSCVVLVAMQIGHHLNFAVTKKL